MTTANQIKQAGVKVFSNMQERQARIQREYDELEAQRLQKKAELDAQINLMRDAHQRLLDFVPTSDGQFLCPRCWLVSGKRNSLTSKGTDYSCASCHLELSF